MSDDGGVYQNLGLPPTIFHQKCAWHYFENFAVGLKEAREEIHDLFFDMLIKPTEVELLSAKKLFEESLEGHAHAEEYYYKTFGNTEEEQL